MIFFDIDETLMDNNSAQTSAAIKFYKKLKTVTSRWPSGIRSNAEFVMPTMK